MTALSALAAMAAPLTMAESLESLLLPEAIAIRIAAMPCHAAERGAPIMRGTGDGALFPRARFDRPPQPERTLYLYPPQLDVGWRWIRPSGSQLFQIF